MFKCVFSAAGQEKSMHLHKYRDDLYGVEIGHLKSHVLGSTRCKKMQEQR